MLKHAAKAAIRFYQRLLSPLFGARCKYYPTCSAYAYTAFDRFGFFGGFVLSTWRVLRCNPFSRGGIDYVPERFLDGFKRRKHEQSPRDGEDTQK